jgi:HAD superfamily hydrolase (TIGR01509 family)
MAQQPIEAVVFDWDGTLMDSKASIVDSYHEVTEKLLGRRFPVEPDDIDHIIQLRGQDAFAIIAGGDAELQARIAEEFHAAYKRNQQRAEVFPGTLETIRELHDRGVKIGIATSKARARLEIDASRSGIDEYIDASVTGDEVSAAKPDPEAVARAIEALAVDPAHVLYVGDGPNDIIAGRGAGATAVGVSYGFHPAEMRDARPDHVIEHPSELLGLVEERAPA